MGTLVAIALLIIVVTTTACEGAPSAEDVPAGPEGTLQAIRELWSAPTSTPIPKPVDYSQRTYYNQQEIQATYLTDGLLTTCWKDLPCREWDERFPLDECARGEHPTCVAHFEGGYGDGDSNSNTGGGFEHIFFELPSGFYKVTFLCGDFDTSTSCPDVQWRLTGGKGTFGVLYGDDGTINDSQFFSHDADRRWLELIVYSEESSWLASIHQARPIDFVTQQSGVDRWLASQKQRN